MNRIPSRFAAGALIGLLLVSACSVEPLADPGIGDRALTTIVYASDGSVLAEWHAEENRTLIEYDDLPKHLVDAVVAIEDERYWTHSGVDIRALARALIANIEAEDIVQGGSTITQQYIKNIVLTPEVTIDRKIEEAVLALRLEEGLTKEEILQNYLNTVYFGAGAYGVGTASEVYFGVPVGELTLGQAAMLAALIQNPSKTDPFNNPDAAIERREVVLDKMVELTWVSPDDAATAAAETVTLRDRTVTTRAKYPYFVEEVKKALLDDPNLGVTATDRYNTLFKGGLRIYTTLDPIMQDSADLSIADVISPDGPNAALVAIDPRTGHVLALAGGRDFYDPGDPVAQFNLATQGRRQAGSSFKPFVLAAALAAGASLDTVYPGGQSVVVATDSGPWTVENYNGSIFPDLTLTEATVFSVNVIYAQLMDDVGPKRVVEMARAAGITADLQPFHSLALGAQEVSPLDMTSAFGTFAAGGVHVDPILVTSIETAEGVNIWEAVPVVTQAMDRAVAEAVTAALTEVVRRGTGQQARIGREVAGKTGTSQNHNDAWFVGYTPELVAGVWVGYAQGQISMEHPTTPYTITGGTWPAQIWSRFASAALAGVPYGDLAQVDNDGHVTVEVDLSTGFLAGPLCPREHVQRVRMLADTAPSVICPIHNPQGIVEFNSAETPDMIGMDLVRAVETANLHGYQVSIEWRDGSPLTPGTVFGQEPPAGSPAQNGATIRFLVAGAEPGSTVPGVLAFPLNEATARLAEAGVAFQVLVLAEADPDDAVTRSGMVWKQKPAAGQPVDGTVTIWVNP